MNQDFKIFEFEHSEGAEILAANNAKEAIMYYFTGYMDDIQTDDICLSGGIKINELVGADIEKKHKIFDEGKNESVEQSYLEIAKECYEGKPIVLVTPNY